jgi:hypothetical protein
MKVLDRLLLEDRKVIHQKWFQLVVETYPPDSRIFLINDKNRFGNPVGCTIGEGIEVILDRLISGGDLECEQVCKFMDDIIRIRAVQEFSAAAAVEFIFLLKKVTREALGNRIRDMEVIQDLLTFESRIDKLALLAFDIFMQCREKIYELRAHELRNRTGRILQRACQIWEARGEPLPEELKQK